MSLLADVRKVSRKARVSSLEATKKTYCTRIQRMMMKCAAEGRKSYTFSKVPHRRETLATDSTLFIEVAKFFAAQGFTVKYSGESNSKAKFPKPEYRWSYMTISWE